MLRKIMLEKETLIDEIANLKIGNRRQREPLMVKNKELPSKIMKLERIIYALKLEVS